MAENERSKQQIVKRLLLCTFLLFGFYTIFNKNDENKCEMTYMFQYPQYLKVFFFLLKYKLLCLMKKCIFFSVTYLFLYFIISAYYCNKFTFFFNNNFEIYFCCRNYLTFFSRVATF